MSGFTYDEGHNYLKALVGDDDMRKPATQVIGDQVGNDIYTAAATGDTGYANRAGALSEMGVVATADADLDAAKTSDAMNGFIKGATGKLLGATPLKAVQGFDLVAGNALDDIFSTDATKNTLDHQTAPQVDAFEDMRKLSIEAQIHLGQLPPEARDLIHTNGTNTVNFIDGPSYDHDIVKVDANHDGVPENLKWDLNHDGVPETEITERDLYDASFNISDASGRSMTNLLHIHYDATHPPDIDDLPLPDGLDNDNPNTLEKIAAWPFDAPGEGTIADGSHHVVAHQDDLQWDGREQVYNLPVKADDGSTSTLHYQRIDDKWQLVEKVNGEWEKVGK
jgi:hypothetical protein